MKSVRICAGVLAMLLVGCAATRSTFDVPISQPQPAPVRGLVKLTEVKDVRRFEIAPRKPSLPSLETAEEINDRSITSRAIARKRGGYGQAMADILLPEGRTVALLIREAATAALSERGYAIVEEKSPEYGKALPLQIDIQQFWAWNTPTGAPFVVSLEFEGILRLTGEVVSDGGEVDVRGYGNVKGTPTDSQWQEVLRLGIADLIEKIKASIRPPAP